MQPIIIKEWVKGIADSQHQGIGLIRNGDIEAFPGAVKVGKLPTALFTTSLNNAFTADSTTDICTLVTGTVPKTGTAITVSNSGGALPTGLSAGTTYYIIKISASTFKLATSLNNAFGPTPIDITGNGSGTNTITATAPGTIMFMVYEPKSQTTWYQDSNCRIWFDYAATALSSLAGLGAYLLAGNTLTNGVGNGLALFTTSDGSATYLFAFRNAKIDVVGDVSGNLFAVTWTNNWQTLNSSSTSGNSHHAILGTDNTIYYCDGRYIGSITEVAGAVFAPGTPATYTWTSQALDLPPREIAQWLEEQSQALLIGGLTYNLIYPWDRISASFNIPISVPEIGIYRMKNIGGIVYILAGTKGIVYKTQGTYVTLAKKLPDFVVNNASTLIAGVVTWGGIAAVNGALIFGAGVQSTGNSGVYKLFTDGRLVIDNMPASGSTNVTALVALNEFYTMGYAGGGDRLSTSRYASFNTVLQSGLYNVANKIVKGKVSRFEVQMADIATIGNCRLSYRTDSTSAYVTIATFVADSIASSYTVDFGLTDLENIEVQVELDGNFQLMSVTLFP